MIFKLQYFKLWRNYVFFFFYIRFIWASASGYFPILTYDFLLFWAQEGIILYWSRSHNTYFCIQLCRRMLLTPAYYKTHTKYVWKKNLNCDSLPHNIYKIYTIFCLNKRCTINPRMGIKLNSTMLKKLKVTLINTKVNWWDHNEIHMIII